LAAKVLPDLLSFMKLLFNFGQPKKQVQRNLIWRFKIRVATPDPVCRAPAQTGVMGANSGDALRFWGMKTERHALSLKIVGGSPRMGHRRAIHAK